MTPEELQALIEQAYYQILDTAETYRPESNRYKNYVWQAVHDLATTVKTKVEYHYIDEAYHQAQQSSANMLAAALAGIELRKNQEEEL
jgi:hypothetical protein